MYGSSAKRRTIRDISGVMQGYANTLPKRIKKKWIGKPEKRRRNKIERREAKGCEY